MLHYTLMGVFPDTIYFYKPTFMNDVGFLPLMAIESVIRTC